MNEDEALKKLFNNIKKHVLDFHVSLGSYKSSSALPPPIGSGTFVKFSNLAHVVYGILTAAHVAKELKDQPFLGLSKPLNRDTVACGVSFLYIHFLVEHKGFQSDSGDGYNPDIAFIRLDIDGRLTSHKLITESHFWDLDSNKELGMNDPQIVSAFFRGAASKRPDGLLDTALCIGGGESLRFDDEAGLQYWEIPNNTNKSIAGGSGAGFWRFHCEKEQITPSLEGVITAECLNYSNIQAHAPPVLYEDFLPELKAYSRNNLECFRMKQMPSHPTAVIQTKQLTLRQWCDEDFEPFAKLNADPKVLEYFPSTLSRKESDDLARRIIEKMDEQGWGLWAVSVPDVADFIGFIGLL